jgi:hypothetical protein
MTPTNLGDLPSAQPAPTGQGQVKLGVTDTATNYTSAIAAGTAFRDSSGVSGGSPMQITITPQYDCWWKVFASGILNTIDAAWERADWGIDLSPADQDGYSRSQATVYTHSTVGWNHSRVTALFRLRAGITYTASAVWISAPNGGTQQIWNGPGYFSINGHTFSEGQV